MKKILLICTVSVILFAFCSCGKTGEIKLVSANGNNGAETEKGITSKIAQSVSDVIEKTTELLESASDSTTDRETGSWFSTTRPTTTTTTRASTTRPSTTTTTRPSTTEPTTQTTTVTTTRAGDRFNFTTTDVDGNTVSLSDYSNAKVIMINMWETWCGPCVNEMPDLQRLYTNYKSRGFLILGATASEKSEIRSTVRSLGVTYPIIMRNYQFNKFDTGYVPTTVFIDGDGYVLSSEPYVGGRSYAEWERILLSYLK